MLGNRKNLHWTRSEEFEGCSSTIICLASENSVIYSAVCARTLFMVQNMDSSVNIKIKSRMGSYFFGHGTFLVFHWAGTLPLCFMVVLVTHDSSPVMTTSPKCHEKFQLSFVIVHQSVLICAYILHVQIFT